MSTFSKIKDFINKDIDNENEMKDFMVLLRAMNLMDILFHVMLASSFFAFVSIKAGMFALLWAVANVCIFCASYKSSSHWILNLYFVATVVSTSFYCLYISGGLGLRLVSFTLIPLCFYKVDGKRLYKILAGVGILILNVFLAADAIYKPAHFDINNHIKMYVIVITTVLIGGKLIMISEFYYKKFSADESKIMLYSKKLEMLATMDPLTSLQNRRGLMDYMKKVSSADNTPLMDIAIGDIDFFKKINDTYGHDAGDYVLKEIGVLFNSYMDGKGRAARWGGEEFLFLFENINGDDAYVELESIRSRVKNKDFIFKNQQIPVTMTFGLEEYDPSIGIEKTIENADKKLYTGKGNGRNRVVY